MKTISEEGLRFIERWEEKVLYVYDDKVPKRKIDGVRQYPEWDGGPVIGTLTIGYGHTDAAGWPQIKLGLHITSQQADEILESDLKPCMSAVNRVKLPLTQHQFDALVSFTFNCGEGNLRKLLNGLTASNYDTTVPRRLMQYVTSRGERMQGLVNRRAGEVQLWGHLDDPEEHDNMPIPSSAEREAPPKHILKSKTANASLLTGGTGAGLSLAAVSETTSVLKDTKSNIEDLGVMDFLAQAMNSPYFWVGLALFLVAGFVYWDRHRKLEEEHV